MECFAVILTSEVATMRRWLGFIDGWLARLMNAGRWMALPLVFLLFAQWPMREYLQWGSREANDLGQWIFALYVSLAVTAATRQRTHLGVDGWISRFPPTMQDAINRWGRFLMTAPWAIFVLWTSWPTVWTSVTTLERFAETNNFGYFLIKVSCLLLAGLILLQSILDLRASNSPQDVEDAGQWTH